MRQSPADRRPRSARSIRSDAGISAVDYLRARQARFGRVACARSSARTPTWVAAQALLAFASLE
jgi:hypothetical protein